MAPIPGEAEQRGGRHELNVENVRSGAQDTQRPGLKGKWGLYMLPVKGGLDFRLRVERDLQDMTGGRKEGRGKGGRRRKSEREKDRARDCSTKGAKWKLEEEMEQNLIKS